MRLLFCCEFYFPSVGGVQEVMRQIAERMVLRGHDVTVATTKLADRKTMIHNGVKIKEFGVTGNLVRGIDGEEEDYQHFVKTYECDAILIKAAQQWTFDALWPVFDEIKAHTVFIPCGFSGLFEPSYIDYFKKLPEILKKIDHLIFYAEEYRDVDFCRKLGLKQMTILPNGASEIEFGVNRDTSFRYRHGIPEDSTILLTVGSITGVKGHRELLEAFVRLPTNGQHITFIMNGNLPPQPVVTQHTSKNQETTNIHGAEINYPSFFARVTGIYQSEGVNGITTRINYRLNSIRKKVKSIWKLVPKTLHIYRSEGWLGIRSRATTRLGLFLLKHQIFKWLPLNLQAMTNPMEFWLSKARQSCPDKLLLETDYSRKELVQAYMTADLFVFASNIEYSPLVLFESVAAGTPFLSVPVGNAEEIAKWTNGGIICPAAKDERGYTRANPSQLAKTISQTLQNPERLAELGKLGHETWKEKYTWDVITSQYEQILRGGTLTENRGIKSCAHA